MKHVSSFLALGALVGLLAAPLAASAAPAPTTKAPATKNAQTNPSAMPASEKSTAKPASTKMHKAHAKKLDLNSATTEQLEQLPGISSETAEKIVADRPFKNSSELVSKNIVTRPEYAKIRSRVMVHTTKAPKTASSK